MKETIVYDEMVKLEPYIFEETDNDKFLSKLHNRMDMFESKFNLKQYDELTLDKFYGFCEDKGIAEDNYAKNAKNAETIGSTSKESKE